MNSKHWLLPLFAALAFVSAPLAGGEKCTADTQTCLNKMVSSLKERGWAGLELDKDASGAMKILRVVPESPAEKAGFRSGDIILAVAGMALNEENAKKAWSQPMKPGQTVKYTVSRSGRSKELDVTLIPMPDTVMAQWVGAHMLEHASVDIAKY